MPEAIEIQLKKGVLGLCVLALLARADSYAYEIASRLTRDIDMGEGTIYPLMRRMQSEGLVETYMVESPSGPSRKYYRLTEAGRIALDHADVIFAAGDELMGTLSDRPGSRLVLRVGSLATLSRNFQIGFLRPILGRDDVEVVVRSGALGDLLQGLEDQRLDVVLVNRAAPPAPGR